MKILHISEADHGGGAERIAYDLHRYSVKAGHDSRMLVGYKRGNEPEVTGLVPGKGVPRFFYRCVRFLERRSGRQARFYWMGASWLRQDSDSHDVFHLHNLHGNYFDLALLPSLAKRGQLIMTLHDCWHFTGHCAYVFDCVKWKEDCHPCCDIGRYPGMARDAARYNLIRKKEIFAKTKPVVITPSQWLCDLVQQSEVFRGFDCRVIYNGIDTVRFCPGDKSSARNRLGLPADKHILLFVANGGLNSSYYKDPELLLAVVERLLAGPLAGKFHVVVVGGIRKISSIFGQCVSQIENTRQGLETYYQAADLLIYPTKADNCPLVPLEAMSCGLPVVSTRIGGLPEQVAEGETGHLINPGDVREFTECLEAKLSSPDSLEAMSRASAERIRRTFTLEGMSHSYLRLYDEAVAAPARGKAL